MNGIVILLGILMVMFGILLAGSATITSERQETVQNREQPGCHWYSSNDNPNCYETKTYTTSNTRSELVILGVVLVIGGIVLIVQGASSKGDV